ncbi:MAG TPA: flagellar protein FlgN [Candidatus Dorea gallistercoris]|uniref:Flagellar protein FlgN n=1 Tax=Candidatus Dorea gallistercoris TaxID=2838542 RepID=A0A9D1UEY6_9FIRM|nr:flagellar protein FlgN [Candidatus Dorea gallistercoris]
MEELTEVLKEITSLLDEYRPLEEEKLKAIQENKVSFVEACMRKEQALLLQMRGIEKKREEILEANGWTGKTLKEVISGLDAEQRRKIQPAFDALVFSIQNFNCLNEESMKLLRLNLHRIQRAVGSDSQEGPETDHFLSQLL